ncbi:2725_t:CDS:2, partial [Racocetra persica]
HQGDMHDFFTAMKRGGMSLARRHIARANIPGLEGAENFKKENSNRGCCLEVKLSILKELHPKFRDYPMCPERKNIPYDWYSLKQKEW